MISDTKTVVWIDSVEATPLGAVWVAVAERGLVSVQIGGEIFSQNLADRFETSATHQPFRTEGIIRQIEAYLQGERKPFEVAIHWEIMSPFQQKTLRAVYAVPYGETRTYGQIAAEIGMPGAGRAVGRANAVNPIPLVIPCHRVVGADGELRGYGAGEGIKTKAWLLALEKRL